MKTIRISDTTLKSAESISFREKIEIAKTLDRIGVDVIEMPPFHGKKAEELLYHTVLPMMKNATLSVMPEANEASVKAAAEAIQGKGRLHIAVPTSPVQMEYHSHKKPAAMLELVKSLVSLAASLVKEVEFTAQDATRAEPEFLRQALTVAAESGATAVTVCDTVGTMISDEFTAFLDGLKKDVPALADKELGVECSDALHMGCACALAAVRAGASTVKTAIGVSGAVSLPAFASVMKLRGDSFGIASSLNAASLNKTADKILSMTAGGRSDKAVTHEDESISAISLRNTDDEATVAAAVHTLGYELSEEDMHKVYENFLRLSEKKSISAKELDVIVATVAMQVAPTYTLKNYIINSSNVIAASAQIELEKDGALLRGISLGDGPVDAAFLAIEQIVGHHFELDDFRIRALTEGQEAVSETVVRLRAGGKLYSGRGVSTDIIGSSIRAYVSALNKICFEENA
ncbi:MAG: hypothetical protein J6S44_02480 [Clostridia bacterium]|nr:hypothetical protein [Clostridia bacterium]